MPKRPNLTDAERDRIAELRERGLSYAAIAAKIGSSEGSVSWACLALGIDIHPERELEPVPVEPVAYLRNGKPVRRFTQADDALLLKLEAEGLNCCEIGRRFDPPRRANSVVGRLRTLARREARQELRQEAA